MRSRRLRSAVGGTDDRSPQTLVAASRHAHSHVALSIESYVRAPPVGTLRRRGLLFAVLFVIPALGYRFGGLNAVLAFWLTYILTRPIGASFADWIGRPGSLSGLGLGTGSVSLALIIVRQSNRLVPCRGWLAGRGPLCSPPWGSRPTA
jgi:hypothetical protein